MEFRSPDAALLAVRDFDGSELEGRRLHVA